MTAFATEIERLEKFYGLRWKEIASDHRFREAFAEKDAEKCVALAHKIAAEIIPRSAPDRVE